MQLGSENWKWVLVVILLGVFVVVGNHAYLAIYNPQDDFPPPNDHLKGDSYDIENGLSGPGTGQTNEVTASLPYPLPDGETQPVNNGVEPKIERNEEVDWSKLEKNE